ncbi:hypothetical protein B2G71_06555 [Novosphingobium sp. PC22D]|uniref:nuclear transport factor 2 family protein n=1 Tax=Novosphingobium sp. PC22D TaxID=1962403 RepID=UPI000BF08F2C|nr:nuclear transport factor 2 family protein [Novosphingobium sp. PC22D]PEQ13952.1 hypothetical protein B2G71_06555 [Novosphingobium sp. PC22D]
MAKFTPEQAAAVLAIKQAVYEWGDELDVNNGEKMTERDCLTSDVRYFVGGEWREGIEAVQAFYNGRIAAQREAGAVLVMRHIITSLRVSFEADDKASVGFMLVFFAKAGEPPFKGYADPLAVADVQMECTRDAEGEWRISFFNSGQIFQRG